MFEKELYQPSNIQQLANLLLKRWGLAEAIERAKYLAQNNPFGLRLMKEVEQQGELL